MNASTHSKCRPHILSLMRFKTNLKYGFAFRKKEVNAPHFEGTYEFHLPKRNKVTHRDNLEELDRQKPLKILVLISHLDVFPIFQFPRVNFR